MNDLAEKALLGVEVAYRAVRRHILVAAGALGFGVSSAIVYAGGRVGAARATRPLSSWFGIQGSRGVHPFDPAPGVVLFAGIVALILLWLLTVEVVRRRGSSEAAAWTLGAAWGLPLAVGPPLFDTSVYSRVAFGLIQRDGHDPYTSTVSRLGFQQIVEAIDPAARNVKSCAGPLGSVIEHLAVSVAGGSPLGAVIVLRVVAVLSVIWLGRIAAEMGGARSARAVSLTALNPLVLLLVIGGVHLQGLAAALTLRSFTAANRRHWVSAIVLASVAGSIVPAFLVVVPVIVAVHLRGRHAGSTRRVLARDSAVAVVTVAALGLAVPDGFGWVRTVRDQFAGQTPYSIVYATGRLLWLIVRAASYDDVTASTRAAALLAMACIVGYLIVTARQRALERSAGYVLLAVALFAPLLNPWYLIGGVVCIAPSANAARKIWAIALSCAGCILLPGGFTESTMNVLMGSGLAVVAAVTALSLLRQNRRESRREDAPAAVGAGT